MYKPVDRDTYTFEFPSPQWGMMILMEIYTILRATDIVVSVPAMGNDDFNFTLIVINWWVPQFPSPQWGMMILIQEVLFVSC